MVILPRCGEYGELPVGLSKDRYKIGNMYSARVYTKCGSSSFTKVRFNHISNNLLMEG